MSNENINFESFWNRSYSSTDAERQIGAQIKLIDKEILKDAIQNALSEAGTPTLVQIQTLEDSEDDPELL